MSTVIALKENGVIHMMADSQTTWGSKKKNFNNSSNAKIYKAIGLKNSYFGTVGAVREKTLLSSLDFELEDEEITYEFVVEKVVPKILERLESLGRVYDLETENLSISTLLITEEKIFLIGASLAVSEIDGFIAIGSGGAASSGVLATNGHLGSPKERMLQALEITSRIVTGVSGPHNYINNKDNVFELINGGNDL